MSPVKPPAVWTQVIAGALLMLATLPGRTHGLGLITEPLLKDLQISHDSYAQINLWATLLGALVCLPVGTWLDRMGLRIGALVLLPSLAAVVACMSSYLKGGPAVVTIPFVLVLLTRALGQGALSVLSLAVAGRSFRHGSGPVPPPAPTPYCSPSSLPSASASSAAPAGAARGMA